MPRSIEDQVPALPTEREGRDAAPASDSLAWHHDLTRTNAEPPRVDRANFAHLPPLLADCLHSLAEVQSRKYQSPGQLTAALDQWAAAQTKAVNNALEAAGLDPEPAVRRGR